MERLRTARDEARAVRALCELGGYRPGRRGSSAVDVPTQSVAAAVEARVKDRVAAFRSGQPGSPPLGGMRRGAGRDAFRRLTRQGCAYGGFEEKRGDLCSAEVEKISLPGRDERRFPVAEVDPEVLRGPDHFLDAGESGSVGPRSYADPRLRGRAAGRGDGLEQLALKFIENGMAIPCAREPGAPGLKMFTVVKKKDQQRIVFDMRQVNARWRKPPAFRMGSLAAVADLELGDEGYLTAAAGDVPNMFYMLRLPICG